jgi:hypothetical protein
MAASVGQRKDQRLGVDADAPLSGLTVAIAAGAGFASAGWATSSE